MATADEDKPDRARESWDNIDEGWDDVRVGQRDPQRRRRRGKKTRTVEQAEATKKPGHRRQQRAKPTAEGEGPRRTRERPAWLIPVLALFGALVVVALWLVARQQTAK